MQFDRRYGAWGLCILTIGLLPFFAGYVNVPWEVAQLLGLVGFVACIILAGAPLRARQAVPRTLLRSATHERLGWIALAAVALHVGVLLADDHRVLEYLKPSTPLYQWSGIAAGILLLALAITAIVGARRRLWKSHRGFQATHVTLSCGVLLLSATHVIVTARYAHGAWRRGLIIGAVAGSMCMLMRPRASTSAALKRQGVFGRHSRWVLSIMVLTVIAALALSMSGAGAVLREPVARRQNTLPLDFPHTKHVEVPCASCHHNFVDDRGMETCIQCHRSTRSDLKMGIEARFHGFCLECHRAPDASLTQHGPVAGCGQCHRPPTSQ